MTRKSRTVADRHKSLQPDSPEANLTLARARRMYAGIGGREYSCTISEYFRTQVVDRWSGGRGVHNCLGYHRRGVAGNPQQSAVGQHDTGWRSCRSAHAGSIAKYVDQNGLVTDDGRFVEMVRPTMSARASTSTVMDITAYRGRLSEIRRAIAAMEQDIDAPRMALLINAMYRDEYKDDAYQRLQYLQLWQSLQDAGRKYLSYEGDVKYGDDIIAGKKTLCELTEYRDNIAHWWIDPIDGNFLADLQRTINELVRRKYL